MSWRIGPDIRTWCNSGRTNSDIAWWRSRGLAIDYRITNAGFWSFVVGMGCRSLCVGWGGGPTLPRNSTNRNINEQSRHLRPRGPVLNKTTKGASPMRRALFVAAFSLVLAVHAEQTTAAVDWNRLERWGRPSCRHTPDRPSLELGTPPFLTVPVDSRDGIREISTRSTRPRFSSRGVPYSLASGWR